MTDCAHERTHKEWYGTQLASCDPLIDGTYGYMLSSCTTESCIDCGARIGVTLWHRETCTHTKRRPYANPFQSRASAAYTTKDRSGAYLSVTREQCTECDLILERVIGKLTHRASHRMPR